MSTVAIFDQQKAENFGARLLNALNDGALCLMISVGHRTGLFDAMRDFRPGELGRHCKTGWAQRTLCARMLGRSADGRRGRVRTLGQLTIGAFMEQYTSMQAAAARCRVSSREKVQCEISISRSVSHYLVRTLCSVLIACTFAVASARSQESSTFSQENTLEGTVVSSTRETLVVRTGDNEFQLFVFDRYTTKPRSLPVGTRVRVLSGPAEEPGRRIARSVTVLEAAAKERAGHAPGEAKPIPPEVRDVEHEIKREARRWRLGVRAGAGLDPELLLFGIHSQMGPIFSPDVFFRPNAEFAFGEVTDLIALNLEGIYRLRGGTRRAAWFPYIGAGPGFTFLHQNFERKAGEGRNIDFGNFDFDTGFNVLTGVQFRRGTFFEIKTSLYSRPAPTLRLIFGYNF